MSYSEVPRIALNQDGTVTIYVNVGGFRPDTPVEVSGYATQTNGAVATFHDIQSMPSANDSSYDPKYGVIMTVSDVPVNGPAFEAEYPIMVVARATDAWITKLQVDSPVDDSPQMQAATAGEANFQAAWNSDELSYHSVYGQQKKKY